MKERYKPAFYTILAAIGGAILSACGGSSPSPTTVSDIPAPIPQLGQTYGTTDRQLAAYKWSNSDQTQSTNLYEIPDAEATYMIHVEYALQRSGVKRVAFVHYYAANDPAGGFTNDEWSRIKKETIPADAVPISLSSIGGHLQEINSEPLPPGTTTTAFFSASLAKQERKWGIPACEEASSKSGLILVDRNMSGGELDGDISDAAIYYCGKLL